MEESQLEIVEFKESFHVDWLNEKLRRAGIFGGLKDNLIELKNGGYILPMPVANEIEEYLLYRYHQETGGATIESSQEIYNFKIEGKRKVLEATCQAMYQLDSNNVPMAATN